MPSKVLLLVIDGIGDVTIPALGDRTTLQVAHTPFLDALAAAGVNGLSDPVEPGLACGSDTAHMNIFGYDPRKYYRGRGAFESMGTGLHMEPGDIAFKSNFATLEPATGVVLKRRADRHFEQEGPLLCRALDGLRLPSFPQHSVSVRYATEHRCGVVVRGPGLSDGVTGTDPLKDNLPLLTCLRGDDSPEAAHTAAVVNELCAEIRKVLEGHEVNEARRAQGKAAANVVLLRGCGSRIKVPSFEEQHHMRPCLVAPTKIIAGLGMSFGITSHEAPGATGFYNSDFCSKAATMASCLTGGGYSFGFLHVKAVDDTGHDRMTAMKVRFLEVVDLMVGQLLRRLWEAQQQQGQGPFLLAVTGDHSTPVVFGDHSHEPVPFAAAHVQDVVAAMGGVVERLPLERIPLPDVKSPPSFQELRRQAEQQEARRAACMSGKSHAPDAAVGPWPEPWPQLVLGDSVRWYDELSASSGCLGRFTGASVMSILKQLAGVEADVGEP